MVEVVICRDEADEQISLDVWNEVWPHERIGLPEVHSYKAGLRDNVDLIARVNGDLAGSAVAGIEPQRPDLALALVTVREQQRRRGAGTALYEAISGWARERGREVMEAVVADHDPESLEFARRRGFVEDRREKGVALWLAETQPPAVGPPDGVEIVTWAERPELARGMYEVAVEALPDVPGWEDELIEPFEDWLAHDMQGSGQARRDLRRARRRRGGRLREVLSHRCHADDRPPRPDGCEARLARARDCAGAQGGADRMGEGERLRGAADAQRRAQCAYPPLERGARLPAYDRADLPKGAAGAWRLRRRPGTSARRF